MAAHDSSARQELIGDGEFLNIFNERVKNEAAYFELVYTPPQA